MKKILILCLPFTLWFSPLDSLAMNKKPKKSAPEKQSSPEKQSEKFYPSHPVIEIPTESDILISEDPYEQCRATVLPSFINNSMYWRGSQSIYRAYNSLSPPAVLVKAAGNLHPHSVGSIPSQASKSPDFNIIIVGSLKPDGRRSDFSQEGEEVHISAPSDHMLTSSDGGHYHKFGGTSGASPLVTGGLAGFEWLAGYHPTAEESKILLRETAIKTPISHQKPRKSGVGMLNSYKMAMIGKELKRLCGKNISCFKQNIKNPAVYKFPEDPGLKEEVERVFPECSSHCGRTEESCKDKAVVFKKLRKAAFLNPSNRVNWRQLTCIHKRSGLGGSARGFLNNYKSLTTISPSCGSDADCVLVPPCSKNLPFSNSGGSNIQQGDKTKEKNPFLSMKKAEAEIYKLEHCSREQICKYPPDIHGGPHKKKVEGKEYVSQCKDSQCVVTLLPPKSQVMTPPAPKKEGEAGKSPTTSGDSSGRR